MMTHPRSLLTLEQITRQEETEAMQQFLRPHPRRAHALRLFFGGLLISAALAGGFALGAHFVGG